MYHLVADYLIVVLLKTFRKVKFQYEFIGKRQLPDIGYRIIEAPDGRWRRMTNEEIHNNRHIPEGWRVFSLPRIFDLRVRMLAMRESWNWRDECFTVVSRTTGKPIQKDATGLNTLAKSGRIEILGSSPNYRRYFDDFPIYPITDRWDDTAIAGFSGEQKVYTLYKRHPELSKGCLLMTTDPGDLVLDPTCGSGTTAYVAERWGRRWITIDTSRVAVALARQRLLTGSSSTTTN